MKTINQIKLDKAIQLLTLVLLDAVTAYLFIELVTSINKGNTLFRILPLVVFCVGFTPFVISQHLKNVPKHIETKLTYLVVLTACIMIVYMFLSEFLTGASVDVINTVFNLVTSILYAAIGIAMLIKLFSKEQIDSSNQK